MSAKRSGCFLLYAMSYHSRNESHLHADEPATRDGFRRLMWRLAKVAEASGSTHFDIWQECRYGPAGGIDHLAKCHLVPGQRESRVGERPRIRCKFPKRRKRLLSK